MKLSALFIGGWMERSGIGINRLSDGVLDSKQATQARASQCALALTVLLLGWFIPVVHEEVVTRWTDSKSRTAHGFIGLQNYNDQKTVRHRNLRIKELP